MSGIMHGNLSGVSLPGAGHSGNWAFPGHAGGKQQSQPGIPERDKSLCGCMRIRCGIYCHFPDDLSSAGCIQRPGPDGKVRFDTAAQTHFTFL